MAVLADSSASLGMTVGRVSASVGGERFSMGLRFQGDRKGRPYEE